MECLSTENLRLLVMQQALLSRAHNTYRLFTTYSDYCCLTLFPRLCSYKNIPPPPPFIFLFLKYDFFFLFTVLPLLLPFSIFSVLFLSSSPQAVCLGSSACPGFSRALCYQVCLPLTLSREARSAVLFKL